MDPTARRRNDRAYAARLRLDPVGTWIERHAIPFPGQQTRACIGPVGVVDPQSRASCPASPDDGLMQGDLSDWVQP